MARSPEILVEGVNHLELESVGTNAEYSMVMLNRFAVEYPRAPAGELEGRFLESGTVALSPSMRVLDTTDQPSWVSGSAAGFNARAHRSYLATTNVHRPVVRTPRAARLRKRLRADYVLLAPEAFLGAAAPLLQLRQSQGLKVKVVAIEDVYSEFGFGEPTPDAVKDFLSYAYHEWKRPSPRYVVLVGDATYDFKDYLQTGVTNQVPPLMVKTSYLWTASDPSYAAVNGDDLLPDLSIGRLPAATVDELRTMVDKLVAYETGDASLDRSPVVLVADDPDRAGDFEADAERLASNVLAARSPDKVFLSELGTAETRRAVTERFDNGAALVSYLGHGGIRL